MSEEEIVTVWREEGLEELMVSAKDALAIMREFPEAGEQLSREMKRGSRTIYAQRRALITMRTEWRTTHAELIEVTRAMSAVGQMGKSIISMWQAYNIAQMRVADSARDLQLANTSVTILQDEMNRLVSRGVTTGEEYIDISLRLADAKAKAAAASRDYSQAQQDNIAGYVGMGLQAVGLIGNLVDLAYHLSMIKRMHTGLATAIGAETLARVGLTGTMWGQVSAQIALLATNPATMALIPIGITLGATALAYWISQRSRQFGGVIEETGWYYLHKKETVIPAGRQGGVVINFSPTIYGTARADDAYDKFIDRLRRKGVL